MLLGLKFIQSRFRLDILILTQNLSGYLQVSLSIRNFPFYLVQNVYLHDLTLKLAQFDILKFESQWLPRGEGFRMIQVEY